MSTMASDGEIDRLSRHRIFVTEHYASGAVEKARRSLALGPGYYLKGVPRYWSERRGKRIAGADAQVLWNPLHEFGLLKTPIAALPPGMDELLDELAESELRITLKPARFLAICAEWWRSTTPGRATVIECGSYEGSTGLGLALLAARTGRDQRIHMFDVFGNLDELEFAPVDGARQSNEFQIAADRPDRLRMIAAKLKIADRVDLHVGLFSKTFPHFAADPTRPLRFAHIDANLYESTREAAAFIRRQLAPDATVVFDDYHGVTDLGARLAIDEVFGAEAHKIERLSGTSAVLRRYT